VAIPKPGDDKDSDYPFVIRGDENNYIKMGWKGDLILHGTHSGKELKDSNTSENTSSEKVSYI